MFLLQIVLSNSGEISDSLIQKKCIMTVRKHSRSAKCWWIEDMAHVHCIFLVLVLDISLGVKAHVNTGNYFYLLC